MAGSPRNPIPIEAKVTPSWQAERYSLISPISCSASRARASPSAICSRRERRAGTSENSAATKKALTRISTSMPMSSTAVIARSVCRIRRVGPVRCAASRSRNVLIAPVGHRRDATIIKPDTASKHPIETQGCADAQLGRSGGCAACGCRAASSGEVSSMVVRRGRAQCGRAVNKAGSTGGSSRVDGAVLAEQNRNHRRGEEMRPWLWWESISGNHPERRPRVRIGGIAWLAVAPSASVARSVLALGDSRLAERLRERPWRRGSFVLLITSC